MMNHWFYHIEHITKPLWHFDVLLASENQNDLIANEYFRIAHMVL